MCTMGGGAGKGGPGFGKEGRDISCRVEKGNEAGSRGHLLVDLCCSSGLRSLLYHIRLARPAPPRESSGGECPGRSCAAGLMMARVLRTLFICLDQKREGAFLLICWNLKRRGSAAKKGAEGIRRASLVEMMGWFSCSFWMYCFISI